MKVASNLVGRTVTITGQEYPAAAQVASRMPPWLPGNLDAYRDQSGEIVAVHARGGNLYAFAILGGRTIELPLGPWLAITPAAESPGTTGKGESSAGK